jgi:hypothetical protein
VSGRRPAAWPPRRGAWRRVRGGRSAALRAAERGVSGGVGGGDARHTAAPGGATRRRPGGRRRGGRAGGDAGGRRAAGAAAAGAGRRRDAADRRLELGCPARRDPRGPRVATSPCPANSSARRPALRVATPPLVHPRSGSGAATRPFGRSAAGGRSAASRATLRAAWQAAPPAPSAPALRVPPAAAPWAAPAAAPWAPRKAPPAAAQKAAVRVAAPPHRQPPIVRPPVGPVCRRSRATRVGREVRPACPTEGRTRVRPLGLATSSCGPPTWASRAHGRAVAARFASNAGRGGDSVRLAIPYEQYQLVGSRAITPVRWRKHAVPGQLIQRYGIAVSECSIAAPWRGPTAVDESALGTPPTRPTCDRDPLAVDNDNRSLPRFERATSICGHNRHNQEPRSVSREARSTADDGGHTVVWPR